MNHPKHHLVLTKIYIQCILCISLTIFPTVITNTKTSVFLGGCHAFEIPFMLSKRTNPSIFSFHQCNQKRRNCIRQKEDRISNNNNQRGMFFPVFSAANGKGDSDQPWWREPGEAIIREAAIEAGADGDNLKVEWGPDYITVTIGGDQTACISAMQEDEDDEGVELDEDDTVDMGIDFDTDMNKEIDQNRNEAENEVKSTGPDISLIARAINHALDENDEGEGSVGYHVATYHSIDVTTPGASNELVGSIMFEAYKGFDVIVEAFDNKKKEDVKIEGKLVERLDDVTIVNLRGRMKKIKNENISSVYLPKAKREKGVK